MVWYGYFLELPILSFVKSLSIPHPKEKALGQLPEVLYAWPPSPGAKHRLVHKYSVQQKI